MAQKIDTITITVGQKKATNYSREAFDMNESITLTDTSPIEVDLFRRLMRIKMTVSIVVDMVAFGSFMQEEGLQPQDVETMITVAEAQLAGIKEYLRGNNELPNKALLVEMVKVTEDIAEEVKEAVDF